MFKFLRRFLKDEEDEQGNLRNKFAHFRRLLESNNQALVIMADMEEKLSGEFVFDRGYLEIQTEKLGNNVSRMVDELNCLTQDQFRELVLVNNAIQKAINDELEAVPAIPATPFVLPLSELTKGMASSVGAKMANLGEISNRLHLPVPEGFAITATAYKHFIEASGLADKLVDRLAQTDIHDLVSLEAVSQEIQDMIRQADLPPDLEEALRQAGQQFSGQRLAVRSSAVGEDTDYSFAGQFATLLNMDASNLMTHYQEVLASKFSSRAIFYWKYQNFSVNDIPMAVGCLAMIPARASGIMFSLDPHAPENNTVIITAVWGLGKYAVDGLVSPDLYEMDKGNGHPLRQQRIADKKVALICSPEGGVTEIALSPDQTNTPCLNASQLQTLVDYARRLEIHFGRPQDIEWALDENGKIILLQSRPLRISRAAKEAANRGKPKIQAPPLLNFGIRAVGGVGAGQVHLFRQDDDLDQIPAGAIVVSRQPSARLVLVMDRLAAIITEVGSPTDHMTILAREFQVPTLVEVGGAMRVLHTGQVITVDADAAMVYPGIVSELLSRRPRRDEAWRSNPVFQKLRQILKIIAPLNLLDPHSPEFRPNQCRTLHDITRFCHEKAMDGMFAIDVNQSIKAKGVSRLKMDLPINLFLLDLGGGLKVNKPGEVEPEEITCRPLLAVLRGFHHPQVRWGGQVAVDLKGLVSVFANTLYDMGKADQDLGGKSFAFITNCYLNFNSRLGYHFGALDAYISEERNDNYISFQFKGGAANVERRERRAKLMSLILQDLGFKAQAIGDLVRGRLVKYSLIETEEILVKVGQLLAFSRQLDLALSSDAMMLRLFQAFKEEDFSLTFLHGEGQAVTRNN
jgi:pyruvate,water dikinase